MSCSFDFLHSLALCFAFFAFKEADMWSLLHGSRRERPSPAQFRTLRLPETLPMSMLTSYLLLGGFLRFGIFSQSHKVRPMLTAFFLFTPQQCHEMLNFVCFFSYLQSGAGFLHELESHLQRLPLQAVGTHREMVTMGAGSIKSIGVAMAQ